MAQEVIADELRDTRHFGGCSDSSSGLRIPQAALRERFWERAASW